MQITIFILVVLFGIGPGVWIIGLVIIVRQPESQCFHTSVRVALRIEL